MLCLNMIVKNESKIIIRLLQSVVKYIDYYCICDTGSNDNTVELITDFCNTHNIDGIVIHKEFVDFSYNRNYAYHYLCNTIDNVTHILFLDADMVFDTTLTKQDLIATYIHYDACYLFQGSLKCHYKNIRIVKKNANYKYIGSTHEYFDLCNSQNIHSISDDVLFIKDVGDGGCKKDKFQRDIQLLTNGMIQEPNNARYIFYLANSYKDCGELVNACKYYLKRVDMGGWIQEIWCSYYYLGLSYNKLKDYKNALWYWTKAFEIFNKRIENLYQIVKYYRVSCQYEIAYSYYLLAKRCMHNVSIDDYLFVEKDVYMYKLDYEYSIFSFYINQSNTDIYWELMHNTMVDSEILKNIHENYRFYVNTLVSHSDAVNIINDIDIDGFYPSSPTLIIHNNQIKINIRYVNYKIKENGRYEYTPPITTTNVLMNYSFDENKTTHHRVLEYNTQFDNKLYSGNEDVRLILSTNGECYYSSNIGFENGNIGIQIGKCCLENGSLNGHNIESPNNRNVEKNWVLFEKDNEMLVIYSWQPLTIGTLCKNSNDTHSFIEKYVSPKTNIYLNGLRGSTNGIYIDGYWWFICHKVFIYHNKRKYYHVLVRMDQEFNLVYSKYFVFENADIEYCLGLVHHNDWLYIGYSLNDNISKIMKINKDKYVSMVKIESNNTSNI